MLLSYWLFVICLVFLYLLSLSSAFLLEGCNAPDEERIVFTKPVVQFSFTYGVSRGIFMFVYDRVILHLGLTLIK